MEFKELVEQAERNARRQERKAHEADREVKARQRQQMERLANEKAREKLELKRRIAARNASAKNGEKTQEPRDAPVAVARHQRKHDTLSPAGNATDERHHRNPPTSSIATERPSDKFVIPKKRVAPPDQSVPIFQSPTVSQPVKQQLIKKNGQTPAVLQQKPSGSSMPSATGIKKPRIARAPAGGQDFNTLMQQANRNDASAVAELIHQVEEAPSVEMLRRKPVAATVKKKAPAEAPEVGVSAGRMLTFSAAARERAALTKQQQDALEKQKRLTATGYRISSSEKVVENKMTSSKAPVSQKAMNGLAKQQGIPPKNKQELLNNSQTSRQTSTTNPKFPSGPTKQQQQQLVQKTAGGTNKTVQNAKVKNVNNNNDSDETTTNTQSQQPQKRYLPGDIRYQGPAVAKKPVPKSTATPSSAAGKKIATTAATTTMAKTLPKTTSSSSLGIPQKKNNDRIVPSLIPSSTSAATSKESAKSRMMEMPKSRKMDTEVKGKSFGVGKTSVRELELEEQLRIEREKVARMMAMAKQLEQNSQRKQRDNSGGSLARIKREAQLRREMSMAQQRNRGHASSSSSRKYANYSETDEDDEDDDEGGGYPDEDDEYDSDLADFIDDSIVDDMQREDFEETLKIINPRYNKEKWLLRERMIDERRMDARFRDVEAEEKRSSRLGLVEDLMEAKRGSKALS